MKKFLAILLAMLLLSSSAFAAVVVTVSSENRYEDSLGRSYKQVIGTLAFDSTYACTGATCGEPFPAQGKLGLASISAWRSPFVYSTLSASYVTAVAENKVASGGVDASGGTDGRLLLIGVSYVGTLVSAVSGNQSILSAVPFEAIGPVL